MRDQLVPINPNCPRSARCRFCNQLGYRNLNSQNSAEVLQNIIKQNWNSKVVAPCSTLNCKSSEATLNTFQKKGLIFNHVSLFSYFKEFQYEFKNLSSDQISLIYTDLSEVRDVHDQINNNYFLIDSQNCFELEKILNQPDSREFSILFKDFSTFKFFFAPIYDDSKNSLNAKTILALAQKMRQQNPKIKFEYPYGHDAIDPRNPEHLYWHLWPSEILKFGQLVESNSAKTPRVSIIIPFYNRTALLTKVLRSLSDQTISQNQFEVILVDDGSDRPEKDSLLAYLALQLKLNITYLYVPRVEKMTAAFSANRAGPIRNLGVSHSLAPSLLFLDSDILLPPNFLETVLKLDLKTDVALPHRIYLSKQATERTSGCYSEISNADVEKMPWQSYIDGFYQRQNWTSEKLPWKYFITYGLSLSKDLFIRSGGFRTNYISFGYEDLDLGFRVLRLKPNLKLLESKAYHLFHFEGAGEYSLDLDLRNYQLALTSRTFLIQNMPDNADYLIHMTELKNWKQKFYKRFYGTKNFLSKKYKGLVLD